MSGQSGAGISNAGDDALETGRGSLFRAALRLGGLLFAAVLVLGMYEGVAPGMAFLRALAVLLGLAVCGWLAERLTRTPPTPPAAS